MSWIYTVPLYQVEKEMVTHSSILAWRIPWMEKPGRLQCMGLQRVGHDWATSLPIISRKKQTCIRNMAKICSLRHLFGVKVLQAFSCTQDPGKLPSSPSPSHLPQRLQKKGDWGDNLDELRERISGYINNLGLNYYLNCFTSLLPLKRQNICKSSFMRGNPISTGNESHNANNRIPIIRSRAAPQLQHHRRGGRSALVPRNLCFAFP